MSDNLESRINQLSNEVLTLEQLINDLQFQIIGLQEEKQEKDLYKVKIEPSLIDTKKENFIPKIAEYERIWDWLKLPSTTWFDTHNNEETTIKESEFKPCCHCCCVGKH